MASSVVDTPKPCVIGHCDVVAGVELYDDNPHIIKTPHWRPSRDPRRQKNDYVVMKENKVSNFFGISTYNPPESLIASQPVDASSRQPHRYVQHCTNEFPVWSLIGTDDDDDDDRPFDFNTPNLAEGDDDYADPTDGEGYTSTSEMMQLVKWLGGARPRWGSKAEYLFSCIGYAIGLGALWRLPYLCYANGGATFLIAYAVCTLLLGFPMFLIELGLGQKLQAGCMRIWRNLHPKLAGIGITSLTLTIICAMYSNTITAWGFFYFFNCFRSPLPWSIKGLDIADSATKFWNEDTLNRASDMTLGNFRSPSWKLVICLFLSWLLVYFFTVTKSSWGRSIVYIVSIVPPLGFVILLAQGLQLPGAGQGIKYLLTPQWEKLLDVRMWAAAGSQVFFGLGIGWGCLVNYGSFNPRRNNFFMDAYIVIAVNYIISIIAGFAVFAVIGYMAHTTGRPIEEITQASSGLIFIVYPAGLGQLPVAWLLSAVFFSIIITLAVAAECAMLDVILTSLIEASFFKNISRIKLAACTCITLWLFGMPLISPAGSYLMDIMDSFVGSLSMYSLTMLEIFAVLGLYGIDRFADDCYEMTGKRLSRPFRILIHYALPAFLASIVIFSIVSFAFSKNGLKSELQFGVQPRRHTVMGNGCINQCSSSKLQGICNTEFNYCLCSQGFGNFDCSHNLENPEDYACPENCNNHGTCNTKSALCNCYSLYEGPSCNGDRYNKGWPLWGSCLGWALAFATLIPIFLIFVDKALRQKLKQGIDQTPIELPAISLRSLGAGLPIVGMFMSTDKNGKFKNLETRPPTFHTMTDDHTVTEKRYSKEDLIHLAQPNP